MTTMTLRQTLHLIRSDVRARLAYDRRPPGAWSGLGILLGPANLALAVWRFQVHFHRKRIPVINKLLSVANLILFAAEMEPEADVGEGFILLNPVGIMLHGHTKIGRNCIFAHQITTTLGPRVGFDPVNDYIIIGDNVVISAGVRIIGNLTIGANTWVGPNTVVTESIPADAIVLGKSVRLRAA
jgi:serine O-acetyltransferase